ncbi:MAG: hypothetical protein Q4B94_07145 [Pseudomonadota bacterium]|nr:hypothetical protein [Pseudomonadota bacterium]
MNWREMAAFALPLESANLLTDKTDKSHPPCIASPPKRGTDKTDKSLLITAKAPDEALTKLTKGGFGSFGSKQNHVFAGKLPPDESTLAAIRRRLEILAEADRLPREIVGKQTDADLAACAGLTDAALVAYLHACHCTHLMAQGKLPPGYRARVNCDGCGTVWLPEGHPDHLQACPWCLHRLAGVSLPRPPVRCADCQHSEPWPGNPEAACVTCTAGYRGTWARRLHTCPGFQPCTPEGDAP